MKVSIIIPLYNVAPYVERCLLSVFNQTFSNIEVILIDDCGSDDTMEIVNRLLNIHKNKLDIHIIQHNENRGLSAARNTGIKVATGDYLFFLDSDDMISEDCIEKMAFSARKACADIVVANYDEILPNDSVCNFGCFSLKDQLLTSNLDILRAFCQKDFFVMAWNKLVRRDFIIDNGLLFKEGLIHEDELWSFMSALKANSCVIRKESLYYYRIRPGSITQRVTLTHVLSLVDILKLMVAAFANIAPPNFLEKKQILSNYIENFKIMILTKSINNNKLFFYSYNIAREISDCLPREDKVKLQTFHYKLSPFWGAQYLRGYLRLASFYKKIK
ncbi:glycosyltransferase [Bacteroides fragilis]|uniref:glycosyltransferase family 2 protein n=1 Tax=Bacteroides TaxID=816 RepID=UPI001C38E250|nr:glycosyltransferase family 2 protein [Bacteroides fragilis]MBV4189470.1 glycosyltransferase [Bacteroides fragilis]